MTQPTPEELQAQIAALEAQLQALKGGTVSADRESAAAGPGGVAANEIKGPVQIENRFEAPPDPTLTDPASLRTAYLGKLYKDVQALSLGGVDPQSASDAKAGLRLSAVYTAMLTLRSEEQERGLEKALAQGGERALGRNVQRSSAVEQLNRHSRLVLLGDPGGGKSTFVNFVALCLAGAALGVGTSDGTATDGGANLALLTAPLPTDEESRRTKKEPRPQPWDHGPLLPVRVVLRDFAATGLPPVGEEATAEHLWRFIADSVATSLPNYPDLLRKSLLEEGGLLLLDGLDEVPAANERRGQIKEAVEDFAAVYGRCRILVTSRTYAYQRQDWKLDSFDEAVLAPFTPSQIDAFVDRWYAHIGRLRQMSESDAQGRATILRNAIRSRPSLNELAARPLLLTLMASLHAWRGGSLPERREELYSDAVDLLLDWWESQRVVHNAQGEVVLIQPSMAEFLKVDRSRVRGLLNRLAFEAHQGQPQLVGTANIPQGDLVNGLLALTSDPDVRVNRLVEYLRDRAGLLVPHGIGVYTFPHRTFQEYLAACHLTDSDYPEAVAGLARTEPNRWREVALLAGAKAARGTASAVWALVDALCWRHCDDPQADVADQWGARIAGQALEEGGIQEPVSDRNQEKLERVRRGLVHVLRHDDLPALERAGAGRSLGLLGDPRPEVMTIEGMQFCYVPAGPFIMGSDKDVDTDAYPDEQPQHSVDLDYDFRIGRYPVSNAQYACFVAAGGYAHAPFWTEAAAAGVWQDGKIRRTVDRFEDGKIETIDEWAQRPYDYGPPFRLPNHPVVGINWWEALAFCRWLQDALVERGLLPQGLHVTLPTEAAWEKAARAGLEIPSTPWITDLSGTVTGRETRTNPLPRRTYPWGDQLDAERLNFNESEIGSTSAISCYPAGASPYGVEEMSGSVWEWCRTKWLDGYEEYAERVDESLVGEDRRVLRGGSWLSNRTDVRCAVRDGPSPVSGDRYVGFRVMLVASPFPSEL